MLKLALNVLLTSGLNGLFYFVHEPVSFLFLWAPFAALCGLAFAIVATKYRVKKDHYNEYEPRTREEERITGRKKVNDFEKPHFHWHSFLWLTTSMSPVVLFWSLTGNIALACYLAAGALLLAGIVMIATSWILRPVFRWCNQAWDIGHVAPFVSH